MLRLFTERTLPVLQAVGMLGVSILVTLGVGVWFSLTFVTHFEQTVESFEQRTLHTQETLLARQTETLVKQLDNRRASAEDILRRAVKEETDHALNVADGIHDTLAPLLPEDTVKRVIVESLRPTRFFDGRGYYFALTGDGVGLLQPAAPHLEGRPLLGLRDPAGTYVVRSILEASAPPKGEGFARYQWFLPGRDQMHEKITFARRFPPYDWVIGTGDYTFLVENDLKTQALDDIRAMRFDRSGYFMILDRQGTLLAAPSRPEDEGRSYRDLPQASRSALRQALTLATTEGGGMLTLDWPHLRSTWTTQRLARVAVYAPWNWVVIASIDLESIHSQTEAQREALEAHVDGQIRTLILVALAVLLVAGGLSLLFGRWVSRILGRYRQDLETRNRELAESEQRQRLAARVFESANEAVVITDTRNRIVATNPAFSLVTGYDAAEVTGKTPRLLACDRHDQKFFAAAWRTLLRRGTWAGEIWIRRKDGSSFPGWVSISVTREGEGANETNDPGGTDPGDAEAPPAGDTSGRVIHHIGTFSDITQRKEAEERIRQLAFYDPLTQLPNRRLLRSRLRQALMASSHINHHGAVLFIDLDNFKTLNDTRGHSTGDRLLVEVAERLRDSVRERDTIARLGGDEFVVVLSHLGETEAEAAAQVERVGDKLLHILGGPVAIDDESVVITPSIGACLFKGAEESVDTVLKHADAAMYLAKSRGRNRLCFFEPEIQEALMRRSRLESDLRSALKRGEFFLLYQPQVDHAGRITGAEALLRWRHPTGGMMSPAEFIPLAEESGLIVPMGRWVMDEAARQLCAWRNQGLARTLSMSVNVSAVQFRQGEEFVAAVLALLEETGLPAGCLKLELTESLVVDDIQGTIVTMSRLKERGVGFSMDDFGTGYSSLAFLKRLPLDQLKIDKSFVEDVTNDPNDAVIVRTIIAMASSLGLEVLAEGVETPEQKAFLLANHCRSFQGYLFSTPVPADRFRAMLEQEAAGLSIPLAKDG